MSSAKAGLLAAYEAAAELAKLQGCIIDRLFRALSEVVDVEDEDLLMIRNAARMREEAEAKGIL